MKKFFVVISIIALLGGAAAYPGFLAARAVFNSYFRGWGRRLVDLEERGLLSREYGAAWKDVLDGDAMLREAGRIADEEHEKDSEVLMVDGVRVKDYPSLSIIRRLNRINAYSNSIEITDRRDRRIALIKTDHTRGKVDEFPEVLLTALIAAEDGSFRENELGFEFDSFVRAALRAAWETVSEFSLSVPKGTSTITQQVAKLFISDLDEEGRRYVSRSIDRKVREMKISTALRRMYTPDEIFEVYLNHCVTSDYGLIGYKDIASGLLNKDLSELTDAECIYLARMVKWGRNLHGRIARQCRVDMPRMAEELGWDETKQKKVLTEIDSLTFSRPKRIYTDYGHLVDLANEFWLQTVKRTRGSDVDLAEMDIIDPNSLIRKKGNLHIRLTIDLDLQRELERLVNSRGYGPDTTIRTDVRVGSHGRSVTLGYTPRDTLRHQSVLRNTRTFSEPNSEFEVTLEPGDTLVTNIRYKKTGKNEYRRSAFYYTRKPMKVDGQYYAYCILDSENGKLLAYYSRDRIGSRVASLLHFRTPNGSSTAKPIFNALCYDLGVFQPYSKWTDTVSVGPDKPWQRTLHKLRPGVYEVEFAKSAVPGRGYRMHNHGYILEGCNYVFDHLATSNNILGVETVYRLNRTLVDDNGKPSKDAFALNRFFYRLGAFGRIKNDLKLKHVTGVRVYKELTRILGVDADSMTAYGKRVPVSDSMYSVALGTLELTLYEQAHLFNMLYDNTLIENPANRPSLVIDSLALNDRVIQVAALDTVTRYHPFSDINSLRPTHLGLHKRLTSNKWDGLSEYDIAYTPTDDSASLYDTRFDPFEMGISRPLSNYAKSGTTDDVLRPFDADITSKRRTNYGQWNAVIRIDLAKLGDGTASPDIRDITIACIGECNQKYTGARDGKSLHKFLSRDLLKKAGHKAPHGFYEQYERYIHRTTPDSARCCGPCPEPLQTATDSNSLTPETPTGSVSDTVVTATEQAR